MATRRHGKAVGRIPTGKGEAIADLMLEVAQFFFRIRARGSENRAHHELGRRRVRFHAQPGRDWPPDRPQIAQMRPTSRQRMQRLADELATEGLVELIDNPRHRRSKAGAPHSQGRFALPRVERPVSAIASTMGAELSEADIRKTPEIVRRLSDEAKGRSERLPRSTRLAAPARGQA
jgi:hypothetical protein